MAPQKSMVISQQQPAMVVGGGGNDATATIKNQATGKQQQQPRKQRKAKPQANNGAQIGPSEQQATNSNSAKQPEPVNLNSKAQAQDFGQLEQIRKSPAAPAAVVPAVVPSERTTIKNNNKQQVPSIVKATSDKQHSNGNSALNGPKQAAAVIQHQPVVVKQLSGEEADDIDAGIELDGSSNSGSSVKDINDDQTMKSNSTSPVMAQQSTVKSPAPAHAPTQAAAPVVSPASAPKQLEETCVSHEPVQQLAATTTTSLTAPAICSPAQPAKKTSKQQLAANLAVIDADEQQLQEKLKQKQQRKCQPQQTDVPIDNNLESKKDETTYDKLNKSDSNQTAAAANKSQVPYRRRFSSRGSLESQDGSLCKVCEQHVYQMERMLAEKSVYHKRCFRCHNCKIQLRVDNYSSHEGQVYCKAHHRQLFQPQVKLDSEDDVDIVAKSTSQTVDDYLLHRGRLSELSFSFLQPKVPEGIRKRQMIICENEPAELPKDVVRSDTKLDDGIEQLNLNLNNILEKFERGEDTQQQQQQSSSSAGVLIEKPSFNIKKTLMAFESRLVNNSDQNDEDGVSSSLKTERPVVRKLTNLNGFLNRLSSGDDDGDELSQVKAKPLPIRRSDSLMQRLKKYELRIAGEQVEDDDDDDDDDVETNGDLGTYGEDENNNSNQVDSKSVNSNRRSSSKRAIGYKPKSVTSIDLSSLKNQWETGDINKRRSFDDDDDVDNVASANQEQQQNGLVAGDIDKFNGNSVSAEKEEELCRIREQLAQKKMGGNSSIRNIYENAIREAQQQQQQLASSRRKSNDLSALNGFSTTGIQKQLLQQNGSSTSCSTPTKEHFQLNFNNKANKLKEKFELGLITNSSLDDSDVSEAGDGELTQLEKIRQQKLEDLSVFTDGEIKAREARSLFQKIDAEASVGGSKLMNSKSLASIGASMRAKLTSQMNQNKSMTTTMPPAEKQQPIRLTNNVRM